MITSGQIININRTIFGMGEVGNLLVENEIGEGKYGTIWRLRDQAKKGQYYVLEHLRDMPDEAMLTRLKESMRRQAELDVLPQVYDLIQLEDDSVIMLGEYVEGLPLSKWVADNLNRPWEMKKAAFIKLLEAVKAVQQKMPDFVLDANKVMITPEGEPKLCGHGIIQYPVAEATTVAHPAPEYHFNADKISAARANVFTLGSVLYSFIKGSAYWRIQGYEQPLYSEMIVGGQAKDNNILDAFDTDFEYPVEVAAAVRLATNFRAEKRFDTVDYFLRHFNQETIPEVKSLASEPVFKSNKNPTDMSQQPVSERKTNYKLRKRRIVGIAGFLAILLFGGWYFMNGTGNASPELTLDERKDWGMAISKNTEFYYRKYLVNHPNGEYTGLAFDMMDSIYNAPLAESELMATRFTGKYTQSGDRKVFSMRFTEVTPNAGDFDFKCSINIGAQRKELIGSIDMESYAINFEELGEDYPKLSIVNGRLYKREGKIFIESTDVAQYWILRD